MVNKPIFVTKPSLPPLQDFHALLEDIWKSEVLTNNGPMVQRLEFEIRQWLNLNNFTLVTSGTVALQIAIKALGLTGDIITTPFTWVATLSAINSQGCRPIFCDIEPDTFNIDPTMIEQKITEKTVAILPVHVFGNPCDVQAIQEIASSHGLKVVYDAAHALGAGYKGKSILEWGDVSATSLHATKILNTGEGGACVTKDSQVAQTIERIRLFGYDRDKEIRGDGFNGKMSEIHAALGLSNLRYCDAVLDDRKKKYLYYEKALSSLPNLSFQRHKIGQTNYSYFPVVFESEGELKRVEKSLNNHAIYPRRYFYPSVNKLSAIVEYSQMRISENIAPRILCLPLFWGLSKSDADKVIEIIYGVISS